MRQSQYEMVYAARLGVAAPPRVVWSAMEDLDHFERSSGGLGKLRVDGEGLCAGSVLRGSVAPPVPTACSFGLGSPTVSPVA